jgi:hypothetical protein
MGANYRIIYEEDRGRYMALLTKGTPVVNSVVQSSYSLSEPVDPSTIKGRLRDELVRWWGDRLVCRRLVGYYTHPVFEVSMPRGKCVLLRNGSNIGEYNYAIVIPGQKDFLWARDSEQAVETVAVLGGNLTDLPPLLGQLKNERALGMLEERLKIGV